MTARWRWLPVVIAAVLACAGVTSPVARALDYDYDGKATTSSSSGLRDKNPGPDQRLHQRSAEATSSRRGYDDGANSRALPRADGYRSAPRAISGGADDLTRVGRWMSPDEYSAMVRSGEVQVGGGGTTRVARPASPESYMRQAPIGDYYAEFDVPTNSLLPAGRADWAQIPGPGHRLAKLAASRGSPIDFPVPACNIVHVATRVSC